MNVSKVSIGRSAIAIAAVAGLLLGGASVASAEEPDSTPTEDVLAASPVVGELAQAADQTSNVQGNVVEVTGKGTGGSVAITLPVSVTANQTTEGGLVVLADEASTSFVPVTFEDGSVAVHSVLNDASAAKSYRYTFDVQPGTTLNVDETTGGVVALNAEGGADFFVAPPWATDADGTAIPTTYSVSGNALIQHIETDASTAYPVVADPWAGVDLVAKVTVSTVSQGKKINIDPTLWARTYTGNLVWYQAVGEAGWSEIYNKIKATDRKYMNASAKGQYICHMGFAGTDAQWNLETWKPNRTPAGWIANLCN